MVALDRSLGQPRPDSLTRVNRAPRFADAKPLTFRVDRVWGLNPAVRGAPRGKRGTPVARAASLPREAAPRVVDAQPRGCIDGPTGGCCVPLKTRPSRWRGPSFTRCAEHWREREEHLDDFHLQVSDPIGLEVTAEPDPLGAAARLGSPRLQSELARWSAR